MHSAEKRRGFIDSLEIEREVLLMIAPYTAHMNRVVCKSGNQDAGPISQGARQQSILATAALVSE